MAEDIKFEIGYKDSASAAVDKTVADIVAQQKKLVAAFKASGVEVEKFDGKVKETVSGDTQNLAERLGLKDLKKEFKAARKHASELHRTVSSFVPAFAALSAAATAAGIGHMFTSWTGAAAQLDRTAMSMGVSVDRLDQAQTALRLTGGSAEAATTGLQGLQQTMRGALFGGDAQSFALFKGLGIDIGSFDKGARRALDVIPQVADAVKRVYRPGNPDAALNVLSRFWLGPEWLTVLKDGSAGWERYMEAAGKAGTITQQQADAAKALQQEQERLNVTLEHFGYQVAGELGPELTPVIADMAKWVETNKDWLSHDITEVLKNFIAYLKGVDWNGVGNELKSIEGRVDGVVKSFASWKTAIELIGAAWVLNSPAGKLIVELGKLSTMTIPAWLGRLLGIGAIGGGAVTAGAAAALAAGAAAGAMNAPMVDEYGRVIGNWGGAQGEAAQLQEYYRTNPAADPRMNGDALGQGVGHGRKVVPGLSSAEQKRRAQYVYDYYRQHGWSDPASLAPVANLQAESTFNDRADNGTHYGIGQWDANRQGVFRHVFGHDIRQSTFEEQVQFSEWELHNGDSLSVLAGKRMRAATNPEDAARAYSHLNERPGSDAADNARALAAERLGSQIKRSPDETSSPGSSSSPAPSATGPGNGQGSHGDDDTDQFGRLRVEVIHTNPPTGASIKVTTPDTSNITVDKPLVMQAMPGAGAPRNIGRDGY